MKKSLAWRVLLVTMAISMAWISRSWALSLPSYTTLGAAPASRDHRLPSISGQSDASDRMMADGTVVLVTQPGLSSVVQGATFDVAVEVQAGAQEIDGAAAYINFDSGLLQVVSLAAGSALPVVIQNAYNNTTGQIDYAAGLLASSTSGTFTLVTITFEATAATAGTTLTFFDTDPRKSDTTLLGVSVLDHADDGTVVISGPTTDTPTPTDTHTATATHTPADTATATHTATVTHTPETGYSHIYAYSDGHAYAGRHGNGHSHPYGDYHAHAGRHGNGHSHPYGDSHAHADGYSHSHPYSDGHTHAGEHSDGHSYSDHHAHAGEHSDGDAHCNHYTYAGEHGNGHVHIHQDQHLDAYCHGNPDAHAGADQHADLNRNSHTYRYADIDPYTHPDILADLDAYCHSTSRSGARHHRVGELLWYSDTAGWQPGAVWLGDPCVRSGWRTLRLLLRDDTRAIRPDASLPRRCRHRGG